MNNSNINQTTFNMFNNTNDDYNESNMYFNDKNSTKSKFMQKRESRTGKS